MIICKQSTIATLDKALDGIPLNEVNLIEDIIDTMKDEKMLCTLCHINPRDKEYSNDICRKCFHDLPF